MIEYEARVLEIEKVTTIDVQEVFKKFYKIDIAKKEELKFGEELDKKYYIRGNKL